MTDACFLGAYDIVLLLLERGAKVDLRTKHHDTSLMLSSYKGFYDITKLLLDRDANPNLQDQNGCSSLHVASLSGHMRIVKLLLERGAQPNLRALHGATALTLAKNVEIINLLMDITEFSRKDLFIALCLRNPVSDNNVSESVVQYFLNKCLEIIGNIFCLNSKFYKTINCVINNYTLPFLSSPILQLILSFLE